MGSLIDAEKFKERFCEENCGSRKCRDNFDKCVFIAALEEEPTAFDSDKVAEKLEADKVHTFDGCINKRYAIEIVKAGGINDNPD